MKEIENLENNETLDEESPESRLSIQVLKKKTVRVRVRVLNIENGAVVHVKNQWFGSV